MKEVRSSDWDWLADLLDNDVIHCESHAALSLALRKIAVDTKAKEDRETTT